MKQQIMAYLGLNSKNLEEGIGKVGEILGGLLKTVGKFGGVVGGIFVAAMAAATGALATFGVTAIKAFGEFEHAFNEVLTLIPDASKKFIGKLKNDVLQLSATMGILPSETIPALYQAISAGVPKENAVSFLALASKAAIGGVTDLKTAVDGITTVVNSYGAASITAQKAADLMFQTVKLGKTTFEELSGALYNVLPLASSAGVSFEQVSAAMATLTAQGVPTSVATTQLRAAIQALMAPTGRAKQMMQTLGINTEKLKLVLQKKPDGLLEAMDMLAKAANNDKEKLRFMVGSVEALNAILSITKDGAKKFNASLMEMMVSTGSVDKAFQTMEGGIKRSWDKVISTFKVTMITIGDQLQPIAREFIPILQYWADAIKSLPWDKLGEWVKKTVATFKSALMPILDKIRFAWVDLRRSLEPVLDLFKNGATSHTTTLKEAMKGLGEVVLLVMKVIELLMTVLGPLITLFLADVNATNQAAVANGRAGSMFGRLIQTITGVVKWLTELIQTIIDFIESWGPAQSKLFSFEYAWKVIKAKIMEHIAELVTGVMDMVEGWINSIKNAKDSILNKWKELWREAKYWLNVFWEWIGEKFPWLANFAEETWTKIKNTVMSLVDKIKEKWNELWGLFEKLFPDLAGFIEDFKNTVIEKFGKAFKFIKDKVDWIAKKWAWLKGKVVKESSEMQAEVTAIEEAAAKEREEGMKRRMLQRQQRELRELEEKRAAMREQKRIEERDLKEKEALMKNVLVRMGKSWKEVMMMNGEELREEFKKTGDNGINVLKKVMAENENQIDAMRKAIVDLGKGTIEELAQKPAGEIRELWNSYGKEGRAAYNKIMEEQRKLQAAQEAAFAAVENNDAEAAERAERYRHMTLDQIKAAEKARLEALKKRQAAIKAHQRAQEAAHKKRLAEIQRRRVAEHKALIAKREAELKAYRERMQRWLQEGSTVFQVMGMRVKANNTVEAQQKAQHILQMKRAEEMIRQQQQVGVHIQNNTQQSQGMIAPIQQATRETTNLSAQQQQVNNRLQRQVQMGVGRNSEAAKYLQIINQTLHASGGHLIQLRKAILYNYRMAQFSDLYVKNLEKTVPQMETLVNLIKGIDGPNVTINAAIALKPVLNHLDKMEKSLKSIDRSLQGKFVNQ